MLFIESYFNLRYVTCEGCIDRNCSRFVTSKSLIPCSISFFNVENIASSTRPSQSSTLPLAFKPLPRATLSPSGEIIAIMSVVNTVSRTSPVSLSFTANSNLCIASKHFCKCLCTACGFFVYRNSWCFNKRFRSKYNSD